MDGIGWQAHFKNQQRPAASEKDMKYLSELIEWAHSNDLEFHVTEIDYNIDGSYDDDNAQQQAVAYANILKVLLSKRNSGVVGFNTWGLRDGKQSDKFHNNYRFIFDNSLRAKPAFYAIQKVLENPDDLTPVFSTGECENVTDEDNLLVNGGFEKSMAPWKRFGDLSIVSDGNQHSGNSCVKYNADKCGIKQIVKLKPNSDYQISVFVKSENGEKITMKVEGEGMKPEKLFITSTEYKKAKFRFNTGSAKEVTIILNKWNSGNSTAWADDFFLKEVD